MKALVSRTRRQYSDSTIHLGNSMNSNRRKRNPTSLHFSILTQVKDIPLQKQKRLHISHRSHPASMLISMIVKRSTARRTCRRRFRARNHLLTQSLQRSSQSNPSWYGGSSSNHRQSHGNSLKSRMGFMKRRRRQQRLMWISSRGIPQTTSWSNTTIETKCRFREAEVSHLSESHRSQGVPLGYTRNSDILSYKLI